MKNLSIKTIKTRAFLCLIILTVLLTVACKSRGATTSAPSTTPPSVSTPSSTASTPSSTTSTPASSGDSAPVYVPPAATTTPPESAPPPITVTTTTPDTTQGSAYGTTPGTVTGSTGTSSGSSGTGSGTGSSGTALSGRHASGIILDGASYYTVVRGDTLSGIARMQYRDGSLYPLIMMVSGIVVDPDEILPEMLLIIPALRVNMDDAIARESINRYFLQIAVIEDQRGRHQTATLIRNHTR